VFTQTGTRSMADHCVTQLVSKRLCESGIIKKAPPRVVHRFYPWRQATLRSAI